MTCGSCGASIADKAIVCYRCGAATAIPAAAGPVASASRGAQMTPIVVAILAAVLAGLAWTLGEESAGRLPAAAGSAAAFLVAGWTWFAGRRPPA
jgi:hypothetical protein